jgi:hypothetical protein
VSLDGQWRSIAGRLPGNWERAAIRVTLRDRPSADRAAALLAPAGPYRADPTSLRLEVARDGSTISPDGLARLLRRVPSGQVALEGSELATELPVVAPKTLVESWDEAFAGLPADWSDTLVEIEFTSTDFVERGAVLCIQTNPRRVGTRAAFRIRCARQSGYGVAPGMARRCLERCDAEGMTGSVQILRVLSDTRHVGTQGPVWQIDGQMV